MLLYQKNLTYFAQVADGLQDLAAEELHSLGASKVEPAYRGVRFCADAAVLYTINYKARVLTRVLAPLLVFPCIDRNDLYRSARCIPWESIFSLNQTFAVFASVSGNANLRHSKFAALVLKDAIADHFRNQTGRRPDVDTIRPHVWIQLHIERRRATISLDTSGGSLHKRGYRRISVTAPMMETLAAAMVKFSGWQAERPLYDPMCGSGTLLCEAWMAACNIPSGYFKTRFGFEHLPDFDQAVWKRIRQEADAQIKRLPKGLVSGSDLDRRAVKASLANRLKLPGGSAIGVSRRDFKTLQRLENQVILCNPPYGIRLGAEARLDGFYKSLGDFLKQRCKGSEAFIYFGNREMIKKIGLKPSWKKPVRNAGLDGRIVKYALY